MGNAQIGDILFKLVLALICGGILGIERERKLRPAGLRTYMLVCLGATLVMMTNEYMAFCYGQIDVARMGAQVISGIGFLGAGTIIVTSSNRVRGLTTAAGLWTAACVGLAIGTGYYVAAIAFEIVILIIMFLFEGIDKKMERYSKTANLYIEFKDSHNIRDFLEFASEKRMKTSELQILREAVTDLDTIAVTVTIESTTMIEHHKLLEEIGKVNGVAYVKDV